MVTNIKMRVTPDLNIRVQEIVFANNGKWVNGSTEIKTTICPYLFLQCAELGTGESKDYFENHPSKEISAYDFIASQGEQDWLPKYGEKYEFSDNAKDWYIESFTAYIPGEDYPFHVGCDSYTYCRPIKQTKTITIDGKDIELSKESFDSLKQQLCKGA